MISLKHTLSYLEQSDSEEHYDELKSYWNLNTNCTMPADVGPCNSSEDRWFFDLASKSCQVQMEEIKTSVI